MIGGPHPACAPDALARPRSEPPSGLGFVLLASERGGQAWEATDRGRAACRGWLSGVAHSRVFIKRLRQQETPNASFAVPAFIRSATLEALHEATTAIRPAPAWFFLGDDDTHVVPSALLAFVAREARNDTIYGNVLAESGPRAITQCHHHGGAGATTFVHK